MRWAEINRLGNGIHHQFNEIDKRARAEARAAIAANDHSRWQEVKTARDKARRAKDEALDLLESELLKEQNVTEVVNALKFHSSRARKLLDRMRTAADALNAIKQGAELATGLLGTLKTILAA